MSTRPDTAEGHGMLHVDKAMRMGGIVQAFAFALVGVANTLVDILAFMGLIWLGLHPLVANVFSFSLGAANSLILNKTLTFRDAGVPFSRKLILTFSMVTLLSLAVSQASLYGLLQLGLPELAAKLASVIFTFVVSFLFNKYLTFRP
ncbi:GtrA family protein [Pararhizobium arenae]|uniref:GtrA family protein n=1 Tax=Pararhizobium arenae TaxID=1856850 RepID=UPI00094B2421|nr:GtrA family protein [Pararhizobium arenae]